MLHGHLARLLAGVHVRVGHKSATFVASLLSVGKRSLWRALRRSLFMQVYHWLLQDRVDYIESTPVVSQLHHVRILAFMALLLVRNCFIVVQ